MDSTLMQILNHLHDVNNEYTQQAEVNQQALKLIGEYRQTIANKDIEIANLRSQLEGAQGTANDLDIHIGKLQGMLDRANTELEYSRQTRDVSIRKMVEGMGVSIPVPQPMELERE